MRIDSMEHIPDVLVLNKASKEIKISKLKYLFNGMEILKHIIPQHKHEENKGMLLQDTEE